MAERRLTLGSPDPSVTQDADRPIRRRDELSGQPLDPFPPPPGYGACELGIPESSLDRLGQDANLLARLRPVLCRERLEITRFGQRLALNGARSVPHAVVVVHVVSIT